MTLEITTGKTQGARCVVDGHEFTADFDDVELLRDLLKFARTITELDLDPEDIDATLEMLEQYADTSKALVDRTLGDGAFDVIFEGKTPIFETTQLVAQLAAEAGRVYDAKFVTYTRE